MRPEPDTTLAVDPVHDGPVQAHGRWSAAMERSPLYREPGQRQTGRPRARLLAAVAVLLGCGLAGAVLGPGFGVNASNTPVAFGSMGSVYAPVASVFSAQPLPVPEVAGVTVAAPSSPVAPGLTSATTALTEPSVLRPDTAVELFYQLLDERRYAELRGMVTDPLYASLPDVSSLDDRTPSGNLTVQRAEITREDESGNTAVVDVDVVEQLTAAGVGVRHYTGTWTLDRGPSGWLLSDSDLHVE